MQKLFNVMAKAGQQTITLAPMMACVGAYLVTKDPQIAALTLMATGGFAPEASANVAMAEAGFSKAAKRPPIIIV